MKEISVRACVADFEKASAFIENELQRYRISKQIAAENLMVFEALFNDIVRKGFPPETEIRLESRHSLGSPNLRIVFPGKRYIPLGGESLEDAVEYRILKGYEDKLEYGYHSSYNVIRLNVRRAYAPQAVLFFAGYLLSLFVFGALTLFGGRLNAEGLLEHVVVPTEKLYLNAVLMVGTPMTFFSILKNMLETYIVSERSSAARKLQFKTLVTSCTGIGLALGCGFAVKQFMPQIKGVFGAFTISGYTYRDLPLLLADLVPADVFEPFRMYSPFALIILSFLIVIALRSAGNRFDQLKSAVDACYVLFSRMLNLVTALLPLGCFWSFLHLLLERGSEGFMGVALCLCTVLPGVFLVFALYALRLKCAGIRVTDFVKRMAPVFRENGRINSAIDAVPYNVRHCSRILGIDRRYLEEALPVLAQINLDGNCFIIMELTMLLIVSSGASLSWWNYLLLAAVVLFLSFGAPNQPGSILIGMLIIFNYLKVPEMLPAAVYCEALFGNLQNFVNVTGDFVMVAIEDRRMKTAKNRKKETKDGSKGSHA